MKPGRSVAIIGRGDATRRSLQQPRRRRHRLRLLLRSAPTTIYAMAAPRRDRVGGPVRPSARPPPGAHRRYRYVVGAFDWILATNCERPSSMRRDENDPGPI